MDGAVAADASPSAPPPAAEAAPLLTPVVPVAAQPDAPCDVDEKPKACTPTVRMRINPRR